MPRRRAVNWRLMPLRSTFAFLLAAVLLVLSAAPALADEGGEGLYGKADDKVITNFGFGLMIFFTVLIIVLTLIQSALERRKQRR
jgi:hypothetical protein